MQNIGFPLVLIFLTQFAVGCSQGDNRGGPGKEGPPGPGEQQGSWTYHSKEHNFSIQLPSSGWKEPKEKKLIASFWSTTRGSPMLAGVSAVKKQTREEFEASIPQFKANIEKHSNFLVKPAFQEGKTEEGNPYVYATACEKGTSDTQFIYVATSAVWLADKGITVTTLFEGQGKMMSKVFKAAELSDFETAARSICLSPK